MDLTLDYNIELFPLQQDQQIALALATSLSRGPPVGGEDEEGKDVEVWRPDGKGRRGLEEDYEYVPLVDFTDFLFTNAFNTYQSLCCL